MVGLCSLYLDGRAHFIIIQVNYLTPGLVLFGFFFKPNIPRFPSSITKALQPAWVQIWFYH